MCNICNNTPFGQAVPEHQCLSAGGVIVGSRPSRGYLGSSLQLLGTLNRQGGLDGDELENDAIAHDGMSIISGERSITTVPHIPSTRI